MSGTDHKKTMLMDGPVIILVEPQLGENIGMVARAMANFGLWELRLVNPRDGWPSEQANRAASRADHVIKAVKVYESLAQATGDIQYMVATTARTRDMLKPVFHPKQASLELVRRHRNMQKTAILFGRERWGLNNEEICVADAIVTFPVNPAFASLNIAQAVLLMGYEWLNSSGKDCRGIGPETPDRTPASREQLYSIFNRLEGALEDVHYFFPEEKRPKLVQNLRNLITHAGFTEPELHALHGIIAALQRSNLKR